MHINRHLLATALTAAALANPVGGAAAQSASAPPPIHTYAAPPMDSVNLFWVEGPGGVVLIDTGRFLSQARYALAEMREKTDKAVAAVLLTHPHTDHYGGLPVFFAAGSGARRPTVFASQATIEDIRTDSQGFIRARNDLHGNDFPDKADIPIPDRAVKDGERLLVAGLNFEVAEYPENETLVTTVYYIPARRALFVGDLVNVDTTPFLGDGNSANWVRQLRDLLRRFPDAETVYPGHGRPGSAKRLIEDQIAYIEALRGLVAAALGSGPGREVTLSEKESILAEMARRYPRYRTSLVLPGLLGRGVDGVAREMRETPEQAR